MKIELKKNLTGAELAKLCKKPGKILVPMLTPTDVVYVACEKQDLLLNFCDKYGDELTGMEITKYDAGAKLIWLDTAK